MLVYPVFTPSITTILRLVCNADAILSTIVSHILLICVVANDNGLKHASCKHCNKQKNDALYLYNEYNFILQNTSCKNYSTRNVSILFFAISYQYYTDVFH